MHFATGQFCLTGLVLAKQGHRELTPITGTLCPWWVPRAIVPLEEAMSGLALLTLGDLTWGSRSRLLRSFLTPLL